MKRIFIALLNMALFSSNAFGFGHFTQTFTPFRAAVSNEVILIMVAAIVVLLWLLSHIQK